MDIFPDFFQSSSARNFPVLSPSSAIMESIDNPSLIMINNQQMGNQPQFISNIVPDIAINSEFSRIKVQNIIVTEEDGNKLRSFLLLNDREQLKVTCKLFDYTI